VTQRALPARCLRRSDSEMAGPVTKHRVAYLHDPEVGQYYYGPSHPMKPHRMQLAHQLILGYELQNKMMMYKPHKASDKVGPHLHFLFASVQAARPFTLFQALLG